MTLIYSKLFQIIFTISILYFFCNSVYINCASAYSLKQNNFNHDFITSTPAKNNCLYKFNNNLTLKDNSIQSTLIYSCDENNSISSINNYNYHGIIIASNYISESVMISQNQDVRRLENRTLTNYDQYDTHRIENDTAKKENRIISIREVGDVHIVKIELEDYNSQISINVYNLLGKKIMEIFKGNPKNIQDYPYEIPSWKLPNGVYICALTGKDFRKTEKFIVAR